MSVSLGNVISYQIANIDFFEDSLWRQHLVWRAFIELGSGERGRISLLLPPMAAKGAGWWQHRGL